MCLHIYIFTFFFKCFSLPPYPSLPLSHLLIFFLLYYLYSLLTFFLQLTFLPQSLPCPSFSLTRSQCYSLLLPDSSFLSLFFLLVFTPSFVVFSSLFSSFLSLFYSFCFSIAGPFFICFSSFNFLVLKNPVLKYVFI